MVVAEAPAVRDSKGRFPPGVSGNPGGRPTSFRERVKKIRELLVSDSLDEQWQGAVQAIMTKAQTGDVDAFRACLSFLPQQVDIGGQEDNPLLSPDAVLTAILDARDRLRGALPATEADVRMLPSPQDNGTAEGTLHDIPEYTDGAGI
jgi:hypothetical protein